MDTVDALAGSIEKLATTPAEAAPPLAELTSQLAQVDQAIDHRSDTLKGLE
jgi:hypothetical protein